MIINLILIIVNIKDEGADIEDIYPAISAENKKQLKAKLDELRKLKNAASTTKSKLEEDTIKMIK